MTTNTSTPAKPAPLTSTDIVAAIKTVVDLRNRLHAAVANGEHFIQRAVPAGSPPGTQPQSVATGQLMTAEGAAHALALQLLGHLRLIAGADTASITTAEKTIASQAVAPDSKP